MASNIPLISCLMVTMPVERRMQMLKASLAAYCAQTYPHRELVIVVDAEQPSDGDAIKAVVAALGRDDIRVVLPNGKRTLGALRNLSWNSARGAVICQWDDDDLTHPQRLELQFEAMRASGKPACYLQEFVQFFPTVRRLYRVNFIISPDTVAVNTLMCRSSLAARYPEVGAQAQLGEDTALIQQIREQGGFHPLPGMAHLYVYVSHGSNTWDDGHHRMLADKMGVSVGLLKRGEAALRAGLAPFDFGPEEVIVTGRNGPAFTLQGRSDA